MNSCSRSQRLCLADRAVMRNELSSVTCLCSTSAQKMSWFYKGDLRLTKKNKGEEGWTAYTAEENEKIEAAYQVGFVCALCECCCRFLVFCFLFCVYCCRACVTLFSAEKAQDLQAERDVPDRFQEQHPIPVFSLVVVILFCAVLRCVHFFPCFSHDDKNRQRPIKREDAPAAAAAADGGEEKKKGGKKV